MLCNSIFTCLFLCVWFWKGAKWRQPSKLLCFTTPHTSLHHVETAVPSHSCLDMIGDCIYKDVKGLVNSNNILFHVWIYFKVKMTNVHTDSLSLSFFVRWPLVGLSAAPAALRPSHTTTHISTNATSASTSSSRCTATCRCCTRSSAWTPFSLRLVYPMTRPSASSSSSVGAECRSKEPKAEWIEGLEVFKQAALQALMKMDG